MVAPHFAWCLAGEADQARVPVEEGVNAHLLDLRLGPSTKGEAPSASPQPSQALTSPRAPQAPAPPAPDPSVHSAPAEGSPQCPVVELSSAEVAQQLELLPNGLMGRGACGSCTGHGGDAGPRLPWPQGSPAFVNTCTPAGATALVFKCRWPSRFGAHAVLAAKVLRDPFDAPDAEAVQAFAFEANILRGLRCVCLVRCGALV